MIVAYLICFGLALIAGQTCLRIEIYKAKFKNIDPFSTREEEGANKWRSAPWVDEKLWRELVASEYGIPETRPLTPEEEKIMQKDIEYARNNNHLRDLVRNWGLPQYLIVPITLLMSIWLLKRKSSTFYRILAMSSLSLTLISGFLMIYRGYFTSLKAW